MESLSQSSSANSLLESYPQKLWSPPAEIEFGDPYDSTWANFMLWGSRILFSWLGPSWLLQFRPNPKTWKDFQIDAPNQIDALLYDNQPISGRTRRINLKTRLILSMLAPECVFYHKQAIWFDFPLIQILFVEYFDSLLYHGRAVRVRPGPKKIHHHHM